MPHQVIFSATGKRFYGSADLSTLFKFLARFFSVCVVFVSSWQISDNLMLLEIYIFYVILNICLAPFYFLMLKCQIVSGLGLNKICAYTCCHILRSCPFFGEHFYLWTNVFRVTYMRYLKKRVVGTGTLTSSTHHLSSTRPTRNACFQKSFVKERNPNLKKWATFVNFFVWLHLKSQESKFIFYPFKEI